MVSAQHDALEALTVFIAALYTATIAGVDTETINQASIIFAGACMLHPIFYVADMAVQRSLSFAVGLGSCLYLMITALF